ncbi:glycosyltransferase [Halomonas sp. LR5S13]|uniref:glycosyltransferase n=1 Tax=Halomonas rhizosphaerae TaxID=3043296 RepID=UPI0024A90839|nr:glycosyltransferase [Halomonas rhizosphaerae]MDI5920888.1 glycosyltransferase [Halomonas rhizosphaerae]
MQKVSMSIFLFIGDLYPGGAERQLIYLCNGLVKRGWQVTLVTIKGGGAYQDLLDSRVTRCVLGGNSLLTVMWRLTKFLRQGRPSILVNLLFHATLLGRVAASIARVSCVSSYRNISYGSAQRDALVRLTAWLDTSTLSNVAGARGRLFPTRSRRQLHIIPNMYLGKIGAPVEGHLRQLHSEEHTSAFHWCFVGRLQPQKNLSALLHAFKQLSAVQPLPMRLSIAGDGREAEILQAEVEALELIGSVKLLGHISEPDQLFREADALVLPSRWEGMPNVLMEAMAAGTPCVATPVGAVSDMLGHGLRGVVARGTTSDAIAEAMGRLMVMLPAERQSMADSAKRYIVQACDVETVTDQWEALLRQAAGQ